MCVYAVVAPRVTVPHREVSQQIGASTIMTCLILTNPIGTFSWLHNGKKLVNDGNYELANWTVGEYQYMLAVTIHNLALPDYGTYQCVAENQYGHSEGHMSIFGMPVSISCSLCSTVIHVNVLHVNFYYC